MWNCRTFWINKKYSCVLRKICKKFEQILINFKNFWKFEKFYNIFLKQNENLNFLLLSRLTDGWGVGCSPSSFANFSEFRGGRISRLFLATPLSLGVFCSLPWGPIGLAVRRFQQTQEVMCFTSNPIKGKIFVFTLYFEL